jgi:hypothetical protein
VQGWGPLFDERMNDDVRMRLLAVAQYCDTNALELFIYAQSFKDPNDLKRLMNSAGAALAAVLERYAEGRLAAFFQNVLGALRCRRAYCERWVSTLARLVNGCNRHRALAAGVRVWRAFDRLSVVGWCRSTASGSESEWTRTCSCDCCGLVVPLCVAAVEFGRLEISQRSPFEFSTASCAVRREYVCRLADVDGGAVLCVIMLPQTLWPSLVREQPECRVHCGAAGGVVPACRCFRC